MAAFLKVLSRFFAILCAILFVITAIPTLLLFNLERRVFDPDTYKQALLDQNIYQRMPAILGEVLSSSVNYHPCATNPVACGAENRSPEAQACIENVIGQDTYQELLLNERPPTPQELERSQDCLKQFPSEATDAEGGGPPPLFENLDTQEWESLLQTLVPAEEMQSLTEQTFDSIFAYLNGETDSAKLSLTGLKQHLLSQAGEDAVLELLKAQPACTPDQVEKIKAAHDLGESTVEMCSPPDDVIPDIEPLIQRELKKAVARIPDDVSLFKPPSTESSQPNTDDVRRGVGLLRMVIRLLPIIPLIFLLGATLFVVRSLMDWLKWWGWPLLIVGILGVLIGFLSAPLTRLLLPNLLNSRMPTFMPASMAKTASDLAGSVIHEILKPFSWESLLLAFIGLAMIIYAAYTLRKANLHTVSATQMENNDDKSSSTT